MMKKVTLQISEKEFAFAERLAIADGYAGPVDCLNGILNTALVKWMAPEPAGGEQSDPLARVVALQDAKIAVLQDMLLSALKESVRKDGWRPEAEDDIPF